MLHTLTAMVCNHTCSLTRKCLHYYEPLSIDLQVENTIITFVENQVSTFSQRHFFGIPKFLLHIYISSIITMTSSFVGIWETECRPVSLRHLFLNPKNKFSQHDTQSTSDSFSFFFFFSFFLSFIRNKLHCLHHHYYKKKNTYLQYKNNNLHQHNSLRHKINILTKF